MPSRFVPALRFHLLTRFYDPLLRWCFREGRRKRHLIAIDPPASGERVLDVGGGTGTLATMLLAEQPACAVQVVDVDMAMLVQARREARAAPGPLQLVCASADALPFAAGAIDRAFSSLVFHHLSSRAKATSLAELHRVLRPGAPFLLLDFGRPAGPFSRVVSLVGRLFDGLENTADNVSGRLIEMIAAAGFADVRERLAETTLLGVLRYHSARRDEGA